MLHAPRNLGKKGHRPAFGILYDLIRKLQTVSDFQRQAYVLGLDVTE
jgi:hypothetical protein